MRKVLVAATALAFVIALGAPALAKTETIKGQIVDQACYLKDNANNKGKDHKMPAAVTDCAIACAKKGNAIALLTADGKVYTIAGGLTENSNAKLVPHVSHTVEITGDTMDHGGGKMMITAADLKMVSR